MLFQAPVIYSSATFVIFLLQLSLPLESGFQDICTGRPLNPQVLEGERQVLLTQLT